MKLCDLQNFISSTIYRGECRASFTLSLKPRPPPFLLHPIVLQVQTPETYSSHQINQLSCVKQPSFKLIAAKKGSQGVKRVNQKKRCQEGTS